MKKEEKTRRTYEKILSAALVEFGTKSYDSASLNTICNENQIPKGLLYHNFKNKDELYLKCVSMCYEEMTAYMKEHDSREKNARERMNQMFRLRQTFFEEHPFYSNIFFNTVLQPPKHLREEIREIRKDFDAFHAECYREIVKELTLREGITADMVMECFTIFQEMFNGYFQSKSHEKKDFHSFIQDHEVNMSKLLDIMLYGIVKKTE